MLLARRGQKMRAVVDTNVVVSASLNPDARINLILVHLARGKYTFLYSEGSLDEIIDVLSRPHVTRGMIGNFDVNEFVALARFRGEEIVPITAIHICRDPDDDKFLEVAVEGKADYIVSGDGDLLSLSPFQGIPVLKPVDFLDILEK